MRNASYFAEPVLKVSPYEFRGDLFIFYSSSYSYIMADFNWNQIYIDNKMILQIKTVLKAYRLLGDVSIDGIATL